MFNWRRAVIKVGSALIAPDGKQVSTANLLSIARFITESRAQGKEIILVSSGSVAAGRKYIRHSTPAPSIVSKQAMAAVGQMQMMQNWMRLFDFPCAQLLITHGDLGDRNRYMNIKNASRELLDNQILPIINENDTVATKELKVGDNDNLAALVAVACEADAYFICTDINGLYDSDPKKNPSAKLLHEVDKIDDDIFKLATGTSSAIATGGMTTKLQAAQKTTSNGINTLIFNGFSASNFESLIQHRIVGTWFKAQAQQVNAKKHWLLHTLKPKGEITIDTGAIKALVEKGASLLPSGVTALNGLFDKGDAIQIKSTAGELIAQGICQFNSKELSQIVGCHSNKIESILGYCPSSVVVHRDDMAVI